MTILQEFEQIKKDTDKLQSMVEGGEDEYAKTHSNCCDFLMDIEGKLCLECNEHCVSQYEADKGQ